MKFTNYFGGVDDLLVENHRSTRGIDDLIKSLDTKEKVIKEQGIEEKAMKEKTIEEKAIEAKVLPGMKALVECYEKNMSFEKAMDYIKSKDLFISMDEMKEYCSLLTGSKTPLGAGLSSGDIPTGVTFLANALSNDWGYSFCNEYSYDANPGEPTIKNWISAVEGREQADDNDIEI